jgi:hypothetical protein
MAWWAWLLLAWLVLATLLALWLGRAARRIKQMERLDAERRSPEELLKHRRAG